MCRFQYELGPLGDFPLADIDCGLFFACYSSPSAPSQCKTYASQGLVQRGLV